MANDQAIGYQVFSRRILLRGKLNLLSGLHVGAGRAIGVAASDLPVLKDIKGNPFIPGSSLKGVLRSNVEAFLRGFRPRTEALLACCQVGGDEDAEDPDRRPCVGPKRKEKLRRRKDGDARIWQESCWVCRSFGSPWIASKVQFVDLHLASAWAPELLAVRDGVAIDRESETTAGKQKFDFEVVPPGTQFGVEILFENPEDYELGLLMLGMEFLNDGLALIGGNTSRGLGRVRFELEEVVEDTPQDILARLRDRTRQTSEQEESATPSGDEEEALSEPADEAQKDVQLCLESSESLDHNGLVAAMQERGWKSKSTLPEEYNNWKDLFEKSVQRGIIARTGEEFHLPGRTPADAEAVSTVSEPSEEDEERARKREEAEQKANVWKDALYQKLKKTLEEKPCSPCSTTRPGSSTDSNR